MWLFFGFTVRSVFNTVYFGGGECEERNLGLFTGYSEKVPNATGKETWSYLDPNSQTMQREGRGDRSAIPNLQTKSLWKPQTQPSYLDPIRNSMQKRGRGVGPYSRFSTPIAC